jgi:Mrp family chromosome partitioning ATPase
MSNYFQTLKRLEREQAREKADATRPRTRIETVAPAATEARTADSPPLAGERARTQTPEVIAQPAVIDERTVGGFSALFDNLRALGNGAPVGTIVIAGASTVESVERIATGLAAEIARNDVRVLVAELYRSGGNPMLRVRMATPTDKSEAGRYGVAARRSAEVAVGGAELPQPLRLELRGGPVPDSLKDWLAQAHAGHEMVIIEAPPLGISVDGAMAARACDGLALVVEAHTTPREALRDAIDRADTVGCTLLGIVMEGRPEWRPLWLRRLAAMRNLF